MDQQRKQQPAAAVDENNNPTPKYSPFGTSNGGSRRMGGKNAILTSQNGQHKQKQMVAQFETNAKELRSPKQNRWNGANTKATITPDGLKASNNTCPKPNKWSLHVFATKGFPICPAQCRKNNFPGTILYYFEVAKISKEWRFDVGFSAGSIPADSVSFLGNVPNSYAISNGSDFCLLAKERHDFGKQAWKLHSIFGDVLGCGIVLSPTNKLTIFFTLNGALMGKQMPIYPSVNRLYPTVKMFTDLSLEANFGDAQPFKYDIKQCPGLVFD